MRFIEVIYSPLCESTAAMLGQLRRWLADTDVTIQAYPFHQCPAALREQLRQDENCFIEVFYQGRRIDSVPLHREKLLSVLDLPCLPETSPLRRSPAGAILSVEALTAARKSGALTFHPITAETVQEEMGMCLCNYPFGDPPQEFHPACRALKASFFAEVWPLENVAGIYAKLQDSVVGLLEVLPRELLRKYGYMTGTRGKDSDVLTVGCYEVGRGMPRKTMLGLLMTQLETVFPQFHRKTLEGIGIPGWDDGFNPAWVYEAHGFIRTEQLSERVIVFTRTL